MEEQVHKLAIYLIGSNFIDGELKLKVTDFDLVKSTPKTLTLKNGSRVIRKNKSEMNIVKTDRKNDSFSIIDYYVYCESKDIEFCEKELLRAVESQFKHNEEIYESSKKALKSKMKIIHLL